MTDELDEIRQRRLAQMQDQAISQQHQMQDQAEREREAKEQLHLIMLQILEPEARERLNTIRITKPDFARSVEQQLVALAQSGKLRQKITDAQFKDILAQLTPTKREFTIRRKG